ncbi:hypothetical protein Aglo03_27330 [Actinokineospora globicatena]|uniref:Uncharacterized protein n=1 Tax=Actinokineospora globicatena TaxID=103729 RepID=A0A9W6QLR2_9PSEU|nr:hypothetical protein Aglo03_27330 [Actinokineospora globicatena]
MDAAVTLTLKLRAKLGSAGATRPNPIAMMKFAATMTHTSRGSVDGRCPVAATLGTPLALLSPANYRPGRTNRANACQGRVWTGYVGVVTRTS